MIQKFICHSHHPITMHATDNLIIVFNVFLITLPQYTTADHNDEHRVISDNTHFKSCYYCRERALGFCSKLEIKKLSKNCVKNTIPKHCLSGESRTNAVKLHQGKIKAAIMCGDVPISTCEQVERADREPLFLCCSNCERKPNTTVGFLRSRSGSNLRKWDFLPMFVVVVLWFYFNKISNICDF